MFRFILERILVIYYYTALVCATCRFACLMASTQIINGLQRAKGSSAERLTKRLSLCVKAMHAELPISQLENVYVDTLLFILYLDSRCRLGFTIGTIQHWFRTSNLYCLDGSTDDNLMPVG